MSKKRTPPAAPATAAPTFDKQAEALSNVLAEAFAEADASDFIDEIVEALQAARGPRLVFCDGCACRWVDEAAGVERCVRLPPTPFAGGVTQPPLPASRRCFAGVPL